MSGEPIVGRQRIRLVAITGAPGVGKTEVARRLGARYPVPAVVVDTDGIAGIQPFAVDDRFERLVVRNLKTCLEGFREWGARVVVLSGVLLPNGLLARMADLLDDGHIEWVCYGLRAGPRQLTARILADAKYQDAQDRLRWLALDEDVASIPGVQLVDTNQLSLEQVVAAVVERESRAMAELADASARQTVTPSGRRPWSAPGVATGETDVPLAEVTAAARSALVLRDVPEALADEVVADLLEAEIEGCPSHGVQRIPEYLAALAAGEVDPTATPRIRAGGRPGAVVDACRAFGVTARRLVTDELVEQADRYAVAVVGLRRSAHLGRLRSIARPLTDRGLVLLGFVNCGGAGQKVAPLRGTRGRLATNPLVLACPAPPGPPVIIDTSTSATSEGAVRVAAGFGTLLPPGLLIDDLGRAVRDPEALYTAQAAIAPLGGVAAHRGYALSIGVELLAGIVAGAGFSDVDVPAFTNGGLFVAFPATVLGKDLETIGADVGRLERHVASCPLLPGAQPPRLPGRAPRRRAATSVRLPGPLWMEIVRLAEGDKLRSMT
jgi:LDH2 family malate/lactate/ureidoglycolate dehydrogenase